MDQFKMLMLWSVDRTEKEESEAILINKNLHPLLSLVGRPAVLLQVTL